MTIVSSLTNRIFFAAAVLAVLLTGVAIFIVNRAVSDQAQGELQRGIDEAASLVETWRGITFDNFGRDARLIADLPMLQAAVTTNDPATVEPLAREYQNQLTNAALFAIADDRGQVMVRLGSSDLPSDAVASLTLRPGPNIVGREAFWTDSHGILLTKSVPIGTDRFDGTLIIGTSLDANEAARLKKLSNSEIAFGVNGAIRVATLPQSTWPSMAALLTRPSTSTKVTLDGQDYLAFAIPIGAAGATGQPIIIVLRSQSDRLRFLQQLHTNLTITAVVALLVATILSYLIARTVTRPVEAVTSTMREMTASGDLSRRIPTSENRWQDEDARLLATTFNAMTDAIARFQREAAQRERLSSLGRLSTVVAHEIRNPLMIIKTALRTLRREDAQPAQVQAAAKDIDEEISRLNRIVSEVLDFARPIKFELGATDPNALAQDAVRAAAAGDARVPIRLDLDPTLRTVTTDAERLRQTLLNILGNAIQAVGTTPLPDAIRLKTTRLDSRHWAIVVSDKGAGIPPEDLPRIFDPFFTTRRTGTGIGLAISRNIIEGLGGRITVASERDRGTDVRIELPVDSA
jgi:signal transduction histidine kinase